jgi:hypothetical protein
MIRRPNAHELIIGASDDAQFGPVILFGHGGTAVEIVADRALALPPLNMRLAHDLIAQTRVSRLLSGYRDRLPADLDAIAVTLIKVAQLVSDLAEIAELDINPLLADDDRVIALDARVRVGRASAASGTPTGDPPLPEGARGPDQAHPGPHPAAAPDPAGGRADADRGVPQALAGVDAAPLLCANQGAYARNRGQLYSDRLRS